MAVKRLACRVQNCRLYVKEITGGNLIVFGINDNTTLCVLSGLNGRLLMPPMYMLKFLPCSIAEPTLTIPWAEGLNWSKYT